MQSMSTMEQKILLNEWRGAEQLLVARVAGIVDMRDVERWRDELYRISASIRASSFKMLIDMRGYNVDAIPREVHQVQRAILPQFLLLHRFRVAYFDLFEIPEQPPAPLSGRSCSAVAHVHHEHGKMALYDQTLGRPDERFFSDRDEAEHWLANSWPVPKSEASRLAHD